MGNFTLSEILTIVLVILIIFGPKRLPELARNAGKWVARARQAAGAMREEFMTEYKESVAPLTEVRDELKATRKDFQSDLDAITKDVQTAADETKAVAGQLGDPTDVDSEPLTPSASGEESATESRDQTPGEPA